MCKQHAHNFLSISIYKDGDMKKIKKITLLILTLIILVGFIGCTDASVVSVNLSKDADQFKILRRIVFYNGITDTYILVVEGYASIEVDGVDNQLELTVKTGEGQYKKHFLGLSDNVTYFAEQLDSAGVSASHYKVIFKPLAIIPDIDIVK